MRKLIKDYLKTSSELHRLLNITVRDDKMYPNYSKNKPPYLVLKIRPQERSRPNIDELEIKIIDSNIDRQEEIQRETLKLLDFGETTRHYNNGTNSILTSHLSGSGELEYEDLGLNEINLNFEGKWR